MTSFPIEFFLWFLRVIAGTPMTDIQKVVVLPLIGFATFLQVIVVLLMQRLRSRGTA